MFCRIERCPLSQFFFLIFNFSAFFNNIFYPLAAAGGEVFGVARPFSGNDPFFWIFILSILSPPLFLF